MDGLSAVVLEAERPRETAEFWSALLGCSRDVGESGVHHVRPGFAPALRLVPAAAGKAGKNRIHLDLASGGETGAQSAIVDRAIRLGAVRVDIGQSGIPGVGDRSAPERHGAGAAHAYAVPWEVLADPTGNEFCVLEPRPEYTDTGAMAAVVLDTPDPDRLAGFWSAATGWPVTGQRAATVGLRAPDGRGPWLELLHNDDCPPPTMRCRFEVSVHTGLAEEAERWCRLGGRRRGAGRITDPGGNVVDLVSAGDD